MTAEELLQIIRFHKSNHKPQQELFQQLQNKTDRERCNALLGFIYKTDLSDTEILYFFDKYKSFSNYQNALIEVRRNERTANKVSTSTQSSLGSCLILCALGAVCLFMVWALSISFSSPEEEKSKKPSRRFSPGEKEQLRERWEAGENNYNADDPGQWGSPY